MPIIFHGNDYANV